MGADQCRWGILGTAGIARKNWKAIRNSGNSSVVAVASRQRTRAEQFINECQADTPFAEAPEAFGSYEELLDSQAVDAVYLPLPTGIRKPWVLKAISAGKHVLVEKPCGVTAADTREMVDAARESNLQFMDGVMFMHSERLSAIRNVLDQAEHVGQIRRIAAHFSFMAPDDFLQGNNIRIQSSLEPLGCLGDLGWYTLRIILWTLGGRMPSHVTAKMLREVTAPGSDSPVPVEFSAELNFSGEVSASFYNSFVTEHQQLLHVSGSKGNLQVRDFVLPFFGSELTFDTYNSVFRGQGCDFNMEPHYARHCVQEYANSHANSQEAKMIRTFANLVIQEQLDHSWGQWSWKTQRVMDACLEAARTRAEVVLDA